MARRASSGGGQQKPGQQQQGGSKSRGPARAVSKNQQGQQNRYSGSDLTRKPHLEVGFSISANTSPLAFENHLAYARCMGIVSALPLFHLYGDPPDDAAFDFIHIETIASRSSVHDWTIRAHRHRNLFRVC